MAPPRVEAKEEPPAAAAPSPSASAAVARAQAAWEKALVSHLNRFKRYPDQARARSNQGDVAVQFTIDRLGSLVASRVVRSSGSSALDEEALAVLQRASPLPAPPGQIAGTTFDLTPADPVPHQVRRRARWCRASRLRELFTRNLTLEVRNNYLDGSGWCRSHPASVGARSTTVDAQP